MEYEIKCADGRVVEWEGVDEIDACKRVADCLQTTVVAWRPIVYGVWPMGDSANIIG